MAKKYTRKHLGNLDALDQEQERIRNKSKSIEHDFVEILNPQQLAISFLGNFLEKKLRGGKKEKPGAVKKATGTAVYAVDTKGKLKGVVRHPLFKTVLKKVGISFFKWQAFNLALFAGKKIIKSIKEKNRRKGHKMLVANVTGRK